MKSCFLCTYLDAIMFVLDKYIRTGGSTKDESLRVIQNKKKSKNKGKGDMKRQGALRSSDIKTNISPYDRWKIKNKEIGWILFRKFNAVATVSLNETLEVISIFLAGVHYSGKSS